MIQKQPKRLILVLAALLVTLALAGPYPLRAQDTRKNLVTLNVEQKSVADVLGMLESSTDYVFFYNTADVNKARKVSLQFKDADIQTVLQKLFEGQDNTFKIKPYRHFKKLCKVHHLNICVGASFDLADVCENLHKSVIPDNNRCHGIGEIHNVFS